MSAGGPTSLTCRRPAREPCSWACPGRRRLRPAAPSSSVLGQAEVGDLGRAVGRQQHVGRLQVAVDDAALVGGVHGPGQRLRPAAAASPRRQRRAVRASRPGCRRRRTPARRRAGRRARRPRRSARCWDAASGRPPRPRCGSGPVSCAGVSCPPGSSSGRPGGSSARLPGLVDDAHAAAPSSPRIS